MVQAAAGWRWRNPIGRQTLLLLCHHLPTTILEERPLCASNFLGLLRNANRSSEGARLCQPHRTAGAPLRFWLCCRQRSSVAPVRAHR